LASIVAVDFEHPASHSAAVDAAHFSPTQSRKHAKPCCSLPPSAAAQDVASNLASEHPFVTPHCFWVASHSQPIDEEEEDEDDEDDDDVAVDREDDEDGGDDRVAVPDARKNRATSALLREPINFSFVSSCFSCSCRFTSSAYEASLIQDDALSIAIASADLTANRHIRVSNAVALLLN
jgi:hypothetical protein